MSVNADFAFANAQTKLKSLLTRILDPRRKIQMIVYLDEAHTLTERISYGLEGNTLYDCLVSAFSDYASVPVFFLSLSTDSRMGALAPSALQGRSARSRKAGQVLIAPFTEMPFDLIPDVIQPEVYTAREVASLSFMAKFGRPL